MKNLYLNIAAVITAAALSGCTFMQEPAPQLKSVTDCKFINGAWSQLADQLLVTSMRRETICPAANEPSFQIWCSLWKESDGSIKLAFSEVTGDLAQWPPTYNFNTPGIQNTRKIYVSKDDGRSWQFTGAEWNPIAKEWTDNSDPGHMHIVRLPDGKLLRTMRCYDNAKLHKGSHPVYDPEKAKTPVTFPFTYRETECLQYHRGFTVSSDEGRTWQTIACMESGNRVLMTGLHLLKNGLLVAVGAEYTGPLPYGGKAIIMESADYGKSWSDPQVFAVNNDLVRGVCEESDFVELADGSLLVISRVVGSDGQNIQTRLKRSSDGKWQVLEQSSPENFIRTGYPAVYRAQDGTIFHDRGSSLLYSCDDGKTWNVLETGCTYYGKLVETSPQRMLSISQNNIGDSSFPWRHDAGITQFAFTYRRYQRWAQNGESGILQINDKAVKDCHAALALKMEKSVAFIYGSDPANGCIARLVNRTIDNKQSLFFEMGNLVNGKVEITRSWCVAPTASDGKFEMQLLRQGNLLKAAVKLNEGSWASRQDPPFYLAMPIAEDFSGNVYCQIIGKGEISDIRFAPQGKSYIRENWQNPEASTAAIELDAGRTF